MELGQSPLVKPESATCHFRMLDGKIEDKEFGKVEESPHTFKQELAHVALTHGRMQVGASLLYHNESITRALCDVQLLLCYCCLCYFLRVGPEGLRSVMTSYVIPIKSIPLAEAKLLPACKIWFNSTSYERFNLLTPSTTLQYSVPHLIDTSDHDYRCWWFGLLAVPDPNFVP